MHVLPPSGIQGCASPDPASWLPMQAMSFSAWNGLGLALVIPCVQSLIADTYSSASRGRAFGLLFFTSSLGGCSPQWQDKCQDSAWLPAEVECKLVSLACRCIQDGLLPQCRCRPFDTEGKLACKAATDCIVVAEQVAWQAASLLPVWEMATRWGWRDGALPFS